MTATGRRFDGEMSAELEMWLGDAFESWLPSTRQVLVRSPQGERAVSEGEWIDLDELQSENERLHAVLPAAQVLARNYGAARDLDHHIRAVRDAVNRLDAAETTPNDPR